jgi:hypothetical protein
MTEWLQESAQTFERAPQNRDVQFTAAGLPGRPGERMPLLSTKRKSGVSQMRMVFKEQATRTRTRGLPWNSSSARRGVLRPNAQLFALNEFGRQQLESIVKRGYAFAPIFFSHGLIDHIHRKADAIFHGLGGSVTPENIDKSGVNLPNRLLTTENTIELEDPLVNISEALDIAFHESILKVVARFFKQVPAVYRVGIARYFPVDGAPYLTTFRQEIDEPDSLEILIDLAAVDDARGPLVYIPGSHLYGACRPRLMNAFGLPADPRHLEDKDVERLCPRNKWATLGGERGSVTVIQARTE